MADNLIYTTWTFIKSLVNSQGTNIHFIETSTYYDIRTQNGQLVYETRLHKLGYEPAGLDIGQNTADLNDFETNYKPDGNPLEKQSVKAEIDQNVEVNIASFNVVSNKLRYAQMTSNQSLDKDSYTQVYQYTGSGQFFGFSFTLANGDVDLKITIDDVAIMSNFPIGELPVGGPGNSGGGLGGSVFIYRGESNEINFQPPMPIKYNSSIKVELNAHHSSANQRKLIFGYVVLTKET